MLDEKDISGGEWVTKHWSSNKDYSLRQATTIERSGDMETRFWMVSFQFIEQWQAKWRFSWEIL